jgi:hypothetical protein
LVGAPGVLAGVTELLDPDDTPVPIALVAVTVKVYVVPFVRPVMSNEVEVVVAVCPPTLAVTVYSVMAEPPFDAGADQAIVALVSPMVAATFVGASGTVAGVTPDPVPAPTPELLPTPTAFVAVTVKV